MPFLAWKHISTWQCIMTTKEIKVCYLHGLWKTSICLNMSVKRNTKLCEGWLRQIHHLNAWKKTVIRQKEKTRCGKQCRDRKWWWVLSPQSPLYRRGGRGMVGKKLTCTAPVIWSAPCFEGVCTAVLLYRTLSTVVLGYLPPSLSVSLSVSLVFTVFKVYRFIDLVRHHVLFLLIIQITSLKWMLWLTVTFNKSTQFSSANLLPLTWCRHQLLFFTTGMNQLSECSEEKNCREWNRCFRY